MNVYQGALEVSLPIDLAIVYAAEQNFAMDLVRRIVKSPECWEYDYGSYISEAFDILSEDRQNYLPHDETLPLIRLKGAISRTLIETDRANLLLDTFHCYYRNIDNKWAVKPDPHFQKDVRSIRKYFEFLEDRLEPQTV